MTGPDGCCSLTCIPLHDAKAGQEKKRRGKKVSQERSKFSTSKVIFHCENLNLSQSTCHFFERKLVLADMNRRSTETTEPEE